MKKMKKSLLSLVTAFIMSASMLPSMMTASAEYIQGETLYSNDLESGKTLHTGCTAIVADPTDESNNCAKYTASWYGAGLDLSKAVSSGIVQVTFDYMTQATGSSFHLNLAGSERSGKNLLTLIRRNGTTMEGAAGVYGTFEINKWYTVDTIINFDTKQYITNVTDKTTGNVVASKDVTLAKSDAEYSGWPAAIDTFTMLFFSGGGKDLEFLDNISVKTLSEKPEETVLYSNDVEGGKVLHAGGTKVVTDPADSSNNCAQYNGGWYGAGLDLSEKVKSGIVQVKFDYMTNATGSSFHFDLAGSERSGKNLLTLVRRNGDVLEGAAGRYGTVETGKWYTVDTIINFDTKHYVTYIKDKATGAVINSKDVTLEATTAEYSGWPAEINEFTMLFFSGGSADEYLDNVFVTTLLEEPAPLPTEKTLYSNDVEGGKVLHAGGTKVVTDPADSSNNCAQYNGGWYGAGLDLSEKVSSGIVEVKFDYMTNATGSSFHLNLAGSERSGKNLLTLIRRSGTTMEGAAGVYGTFETGKWYTINTVINFDTKHYMTAVIDKATGRVLKSVDTTLEPTTAEYSGWPAEIDEFTMLFFSGGSADEYLDNVLVKTLLEEPAPMPETPEPEEPEVNKNVLYSNNYEKASGTDNYIINTAADGNKYLTIKARWWALQNKFENVSKNKIKVKFDFMNTASGSSFYAALADSSVSTSDGTEQLVLIRDEAKMECYSSTQNRNILGNHIENEWLTYEAIIDINTKHCISTVYNKASGDAIATVEVTLEATDGNLADWPKTATGFDTFLIQTGRGEGTHIDNVVIEKVVDAPTVSASKITVKDSLGAVQNVWTDVSPLMKTIEIDFATIMDDATVTENEIYVTKKGSETPLEATVSCADGVAVWTLADTEKLDRATEYVLHISADVANEIGETLGEDVTYSFTTNKGMVSAVMNAPKVGENAVTGFANLTAGDLIKVPVTYVNTTGEAKDLYFVVAYYKSGFKTLADVEFIKTPFVGTITNGEYDFEHTFKKVDGADSMRFMMWDGFDTLVPLSASVSIK